MKNRTPQRHDPAKIKDALAQLEAGKSLTDVAREFGVSKSLVSYWRDNAAELVPEQGRQSGKGKQNVRSRKFVLQCWQSIGLAFKRLDAELKSDKPHGVRDLALAIAVLADKMTQASQKLETQAAPSAAAGWSMSEDTLLILRQHREAKLPVPPEKIVVVEASLAGSGLEPQKRPEGGAAIAAEIVADELGQVPRIAPGGN
ncbi:MAG TPA: hypothetical protein DCZ01_11355 [Elusimicrobia bacterium]|nr:MAG: hypothetical protein A2X40_03500 [Elusimicrobia bacterium GWC2_65_9]OHC65924.1 MAG: hypothetical protein A2040_13150 [Rhodocyclales bacterium GWA2_65_19]HAZ09089.1 hypothetical protein [Elusimicrobiota bacterium]